MLGRERGDILFPEDGYVSGTHAQLTLRDGQVYLSDLGSSNGTFFRIRGSRMVASGSLLLMGQQLFRATLPVTGRGRPRAAASVPFLPFWLPATSGVAAWCWWGRCRRCPCRRRACR